MSQINLPNSPVKNITSCPKCGDVSVKFYNPIHDTRYSREEWDWIMTEGEQALAKIVRHIIEDPKQFP